MVIMVKKYIVNLAVEERQKLESLINKGRIASYKRKHAQILLKSDISELGKCWTDSKISEAFDITTRTIENVRKRFVMNGLDAAINRAKSIYVRPCKINGEQEAHLLALTCGEAPDGHCRWSLRLLADKMVELEYIDTVSHETIRQTLKKMK